MKAIFSLAPIHRIIEEWSWEVIARSHLFHLFSSIYVVLNLNLVLSNLWREIFSPFSHSVTCWYSYYFLEIVLPVLRSVGSFPLPRGRWRETSTHWVFALWRLPFSGFHKTSTEFLEPFSVFLISDETDVC